VFKFKLSLEYVGINFSLRPELCVADPHNFCQLQRLPHQLPLGLRTRFSASLLARNRVLHLGSLGPYSSNCLVVLGPVILLVSANP
jgi:hypothetical protein